ncbi:DUF2271 domain-containing protein [Thalassotalea sediminis]|uniref:DUF2271 domain-containing protein n=1 Tax=Thalassotalea sediminis TaxID=1759089 RepID=UPI002572F805|nr:DUF2271 domain-containing protein [Thalassotalea sediminis]
MLKHIFTLFTLVSVAIAANTYAQSDVQLEINIPRLTVAEYHKPYVAIWLEDTQRKATQIAIWYDFEMENHKGEEWLADLRQWWRRGGRKLALPVDGITGATKAPGTHLVTVDLASLLKQQPAGKYKLRIEAAREVGGRELIQLPITLPLNTKALPIKATGKRELGLITLSAVK